MAVAGSALRSILLSLLILSSHAGLAADAAVARAKALLEAGKAQQAYELLETDADANVNDVEYNYLLGIAALDAGKPGLAVFALERALTLNPQHAPARAELARAYLALGESDSARAELEEVKRLNPPPQVARTIGDVLSAIDLYERDRQAVSAGPGLTGYLSADVGYDTNINTATNATSIAIPGLLNLVIALPRILTAQPSPFVGLGGGINYQRKIQENVTGFVGANASGRYNTREDDFYTYSMGGNGGVRIERGKDSYTVGLNTNQFYVNKFHIDDYRGAFGQWQRQLDRDNQITVFGQYFDIDHPYQDLLSTRLYLGGGSWAHAFQGRGSPVLALTGYGADEREKGNDPSIGRTYYGARASLEYSYSDRLKLNGGVGVQRSRYGAMNVFFNNTRTETRYDLNLGATFIPAKNWSITPQILYTRNDSNIPITDFNRTQALVSIRRDFQ